MRKTEFETLMITLKRLLKMKKITYREIGEKLELSESSVKRILSSRDGKLGIIERICQILEISLTDLFEERKKDFVPEEYILTKKQTSFFLKNLFHFHFFTRIYSNRETIEQIKFNDGLTKKSIFRYLRDLEKLGLLELHPKDKFKFLIQGSLIVKDGPLKEKLLEESFKWMHLQVKRKDLETTICSVRQIKLSENSRKEFQRKVENLEKEYFEIGQREEKIYRHHMLDPLSYIFSICEKKLLECSLPNLKD